MEKFIKKIKKNYKAHFITSNQPPASVKAFMEEIGEEEQEFFKYYKSFSELDKDLWKDVVVSTLERVKSEAVFQDYAVREKMLSFLFTLIEVLKDYHAFVTYQFKNKKNERFGLTPTFLDDFKHEFMLFANEMVNEGLDTTEIVNRPFISEKYAESLWVEVLFIISFWNRDKSENKEQTDAAIEKSSNFAFDLLGQTPLDSAFDLVKFLIQKK
ncbi:MAG: hypothetical protein CMO01_27000 [Thalassobius sp.]|nr:hypothetical protein [Thalassovita sp.]